MNHLILLDIPGTYSWKPGFQRTLRPFVSALASAGIRANQVTIAAGVLSASVGVWLLFVHDVRWFLLLPLALFMRMALNAADGVLAREFGQGTKLGVYLNELTDVASDVFLYLPFAHLHGFSPFWIWNVVVLALISEMAGAVAVMAGASRRYDGPMAKSDRAMVFGALALWAGLAGGVPTWVGDAVTKILTSLLLLTIVNRVRGGLHELPSRTNVSVPLLEENEYAAM